MIHKLSLHRVNALVRAGEIGRHNDGGGLYLDINQSGAYWLFRYHRFTKQLYLGLGPVHTVSLVEAREAALGYRKDLRAGRDPVQVRKAARAAAKLEAARSITFNDYADSYRADHAAEWKSAVHRQQWENSLKTYCSPVFGDVPVRDVDTTLILRALRPIWQEKPETATRLRGRIENILGAATAEGLRTGDNPARWADHLEKLLVSREKLKRKHHPALPYEQINEFITELRTREGVAPKALEFLILTACRTGDLIGQNGEDRRPPMMWAHVDEALWTVPATKTDTEHTIPLSAAALAVLKEVKGLDDVIVFPSPQGGPLGNPPQLNAGRVRTVGSSDVPFGETTVRPKAIRKQDRVS